MDDEPIDLKATCAALAGLRDETQTLVKNLRDALDEVDAQRKELRDAMEEVDALRTEMRQDRAYRKMTPLQRWEHNIAHHARRAVTMSDEPTSGPTSEPPPETAKSTRT